MPIHGVTDTHEPGRGLPRLAKLVKGAARSAEDLKRNKPGGDLSHFCAVWQDDYQHLAPAFDAMYGAEPRTISGLYLIANHPHVAMDAWFETWSQSGLKLRCDGHAVERWFDPSRGRLTSDNVPACGRETGACGCKPAGRIGFVLPAFTQQTGALGVFLLETHSLIDITKLNATLNDVFSLYGTITGIPFTLSRIEQDIPQPDIKNGRPTGKVMHVKKWMLRLTVDASYVKSLASGLIAPPTHDIEAGGRMTHALPEPTHSAHSDATAAWSADEAKAWAQAQISNGLTMKNIFDALGISRLGEWSGSTEQAQAQLIDWLDSEVAGEHDEVGEES
jgi:hypothetical protein